MSRSWGILLAVEIEQLGRLVLQDGVALHAGFQ